MNQYDIRNIKISILNIYGVLESKHLLSPDEMKKAILDTISLVGGGVLGADEIKKINETGVIYEDVVKSLKKEGRLE